MHRDDIETQIFEHLVDDPDTPGGLSDDAQQAEPGNFLRHVAALSASKSADGLIDPKLVLAWLLTHLGAGPVWGGLLVPVREAGALLPQLFTAGAIHGLARRKWAWAAGSAGQGVAAFGIAGAALTLDGAAAGAVIVALLGMLALARSVCSVAYKDVLGKTVGRARRGTATGLAASVASAAVLGFAGLLIARGQSAGLVVGAVALAGALWLGAGAIFATLREAPQPGQAMGARDALAQMALLRDAQLRRFIIARGLLVGTALAPPYLVMMAGQGALSGLGALVLASALASLVSSWVWGRLSDRSSRRVLIYAGGAGAGALALSLVAPGWALPVVLMGLMVAYHGVRQGRSTHLVDMAPDDKRAAYTAVSNTVVGVVLLGAGGAFAALASVSVALTVGAFAAMCVAGALIAMGLDEVQ